MFTPRYQFELERADRSFAAINATLDRLSNDELAELKSAYLSTIDSVLANFYAPINPRTGASLRVGMFEFLNRKRSVAA